MAKYTIGQIANIIGISRDKLRYYEEKGILTPRQSDENSYRQYDFKDIDTVLAIDFYRSLDLEFKTIKRLYDEADIKDIELILNEKHKEIMKEIDRLKTIVDRIEMVKRGCSDIERYLGKYTIKSMAPIKILGEISDFRAYDEFEIIHENRNELRETSIIKSLKRYITFNETEIKSNKMLITKDIPYEAYVEANDMLRYEKCVYTIVEDALEKKDTMKQTFLKSQEWINKNGYKHKGEAIISMILVAYDQGREKSYLEIYIPIE